MKKIFTYNDKNIEVEILSIDQFQVKFKYENEIFEVSNLGDIYALGQEYFKVHNDEDETCVNGETINLKQSRTIRTNKQKTHTGDMLSPMPGKILKINLVEGQSFKAGEALVVMEAMKMEHTIKASVDGVLTKYLVSVGQTIQGGIHLFEFDKV